MLRWFRLAIGIGLRPPRLPVARNGWSLSWAAESAVAEQEEEEMWSSFLQACVHDALVDEGRAVHARITKTHFASTFLLNHLLNMYAKCGCLADAHKVLDEMPHRNVVSWSAMIAGYVQRGDPESALSLFVGMQRDGIAPNHFTLVSALNACTFSNLPSLAKQIYVRVVQLGFESNVFLINAFITALVRQGNLREAEELFEKANVRDVVSWNAMITGYVQLACSEVWRFWCRMSREGAKPDQFTFASVLAGLAATAVREHGLQVHGQLVKSGYRNDTCVANALVDMYLKSGDLNEGLEAFDEMDYRNAISWTEIIGGCLHHGQPNKALELFEEMKLVGVMPNKFTLATTINSCASLVSLEEGKKLHGLRMKLAEEVDDCVDNALIDMYAKCGCLEDACSVFHAMRERSVVSWTTIIMGCAQNGRVDEAIQFFDLMCANGVKPNHITYVCVLYACSQGGHVDRGMQYFSKMRQDHQIQPEEDHYTCMVDMLGRAGRVAEAEALIHSMTNLPSTLVWQTLLGACRMHGDLEAGKRAAERALALDKCDPSTYVLLSNIYADLCSWGDVHKVRKMMKNREVKKNPGCSWIELKHSNVPRVLQNDHWSMQAVGLRCIHIRGGQ
ncbi:Pentatricopeptide repeat-containing protein [Nymphaea thermarum]|nr:Pentatricopeptide repeat-containing protein [Nymphaea thermarum]